MAYYEIVFRYNMNVSFDYYLVNNLSLGLHNFIV